MFEQRFSLLHRAIYDMPEFAFRAEPTRLLDSNQFSTEQRFFAQSRPADIAYRSGWSLSRGMAANA
jgi:hypothetical protein